MADIYGHLANGLTTPIVDAVEVTPSDTEDLPQVTRALWIGGAGDLRVMYQGGAIVSYRAVPVGMQVRRVIRVMASGTTATNIVADW